MSSEPCFDLGRLKGYRPAMQSLRIKPERAAQLEALAQQRGQDPAELADEALASWLAGEEAEYQDTVAAIRRAHEPVKAGRTRPAGEFFAELRRKYDLPDRNDG